MLAGQLLRSRCRHYTTAGPSLLTVQTLPDNSIATFKHHAFIPAQPALLPRSSFATTMPAITKWFTTHPKSPILNHSYLSRFGSTLVPLEITSPEGKFVRLTHSLSFFLEAAQAASSKYIFTAKSPQRYFNAYIPPHSSASAKTRRSRPLKSKTFFSPSSSQPLPQPTITKPTAQVYLAQCPIPDLPLPLRDDVPTPEIVKSAGKGDIYDSSIWLGAAPTFTPWHRDPNPNIFVQLCGQKSVRMLPPAEGRSILLAVQERLGAGEGSVNLRGEEMMQGMERNLLHEAVWGEGFNGFEVSLNAGDALFIPLGWFHSVKSAGKGMTGSANWWFR